MQYQLLLQPNLAEILGTSLYLEPRLNIGGPKSLFDLSGSRRRIVYLSLDHFFNCAHHTIHVSLIQSRDVDSTIRRKVYVLLTQLFDLLRREREKTASEGCH